MPHSTIQNLQVIYTGSVGTYAPESGDAWETSICGWCGGTQMAIVAKAPGSGLQWMRCVTCLKPSVSYYGNVFPGRKPLRVPKGLPPIDQAIWEEVRSCLSVGADTAAVMLCRKLLFHIAVANGLPAKDDKDRAPTFAAAVAKLEDEGLITRRMRPWVDRIKDVGNDANHEIQPVAHDLALDVATFTEQLLILAYELDALQAEAESTQ